MLDVSSPPARRHAASATVSAAFLGPHGIAHLAGVTNRSDRTENLESVKYLAGLWTIAVSVVGLWAAVVGVAVNVALLALATGAPTRRGLR